MRIQSRSAQRPLAYGVNYASPQARGLVGWWPLDRARGLRNMVGPTSGAYTGTVAGTPLLGICHDIDDSTDSTLVTTYTALNDLTQLTLSAWYTSRTAGGGSLGRIVDKNNLGNGWNIQSKGAGSMGFEFRRWSVTNGEWSFPCPAMDASSAVMPHHVAVSYDTAGGTGAVPLVLIDGVLRTTTTLSTPAGVATDSEVSDLRIGNRSDLSRTWDGTLADIRVYNRAMTAAEMLALWDQATRWELYSTVAQKVGTIVSGNAIAAAGWGALMDGRRNRLVA